MKERSTSMLPIVVSYSGGVGSWGAAKRLIDTYGVDRVDLLFADTFIEDNDLYRFLIQSAAKLYGIETDLHESALFLPPLIKIDERKEAIKDLSRRVSSAIPHLTWIYKGEDVWECFSRNKFMANSRIDICSKELKRLLIKQHSIKKYGKHGFISALGIDWTEIHRLERVKERTVDYEVVAPLCEEPYLTKKDLFDQLKADQIRPPRLYELNFAHNNCGGFCVKSGQGQFARLLKALPEVYAYHEKQESDFQRKFNTDATILRYQKDNVKYRLSLKDLRGRVERGEYVDMFDIGGCACAVE